MSNSMHTYLGIALAGAALALGGCNSAEDDLASLDNSITGNDSDPALTSALEDQILVDPALTQQSNKNAVRPPERPTRGEYPPEERQAQVMRGGRPVSGASGASGIGGNCITDLEHGSQWAQRVPAAFAVYPGARVTDAAGKETTDCSTRVVTFTTQAAPERVLQHYRGRAVQAGYSAERQMRDGDHILAGAHGQDESAFYLIVTPQGGGSDVAVIANQGR